MDRTEIVTNIARVAHEVNRAYCAALGDASQKAWEDAPEWQKQSAIAGVEFHLAGDHPAHASHENWMKHKQADGWQYGPVKNETKKTHPCMVPFAHLSQEQQIKDHLFRAVVHSLRSKPADLAAETPDPEASEAPKVTKPAKAAKPDATKP